MPFDWFFKGSRRGNQRHDILQSDDDNIEDIDINPRAEDSFHVPFIDPFGTSGDRSHDIFQHFDNMLSLMFSASIGPESFFETDTNESNLRSIMLKDPNCEGCDPPLGLRPFEMKKPSLLIDSDIDDKVAKHGLLHDENSEINTPDNFSFRKFSSIKTVRLSDGTLEEHRSFTDSQGNKTSTVRRSIGDQSYEVTTHSDTQGLKEKQENFTNLDECALPEFEKKWQSIKSKNGIVPSLDMQSESTKPKLILPSGDPSYSSLFKKFFSI